VFRRSLSWILGLVGAVAGGALGFYAFGWLLSHDIYAMVLPGSLVGIGCGLLARRSSWLRGLLCGLGGLALGLFCEWHYIPFVKDRSLEFFVTHMHKIPIISLIFIGLGGLVSAWFGRGYLIGRSRKARKAS